MTTVTGSVSADAYLTQAITDLMAEEGFKPESLDNLTEWAYANTQKIVEKAITLQYGMVSKYMANKKQIHAMMTDRIYETLKA